MRIKKATGSEERSLPFIFSFITLRQEKFGAIAFNPFLDAELELDPVEAGIASICEGTSTVENIERSVSSAFGLSGRESQIRVYKTLCRLSSIMALGFRDGEGQGGIQDIKRPKQSKNGPFLSAPRSVTWEVTYACNLRCPHCFTESGSAGNDELSTDKAMELIDKLAEAKVLRLLISGGEPFLRPDMLALLRHASGTNMRLDIATNGVYMPKKVLEGLRGLPVYHAHVSIDGIGRKHDLFRGREGAFDAACGTVRKLRDEGIAVSLSTTVTRENIDELDHIIDLAVALGCSGFFANAMLPVGRGRLNAARYMLDVNEYYRLYGTLVKRGNELREKLSINTNMCFPFLLSPQRSARYSGDSMGCAAGYDTLCVGADGTVYPCHFLHDFPIGNLMADSLDRIWNKSPVLKGLRSLRKQDMAGECRECGYAPSPCRGGCRAAAYLVKGDLKEKDATCFKSLVDNGFISNLKY